MLWSPQPSVPSSLGVCGCDSPSSIIFADMLDDELQFIEATKTLKSRKKAYQSTRRVTKLAAARWTGFLESIEEQRSRRARQRNRDGLL